MKTARLSRAALTCTWPSQGASGADFYSLYFLPQDANVLRTDANPLLGSVRPGWQRELRWLREHGQELHDYRPEVPVES
jgi:hypothetical protein